MNQRTGEIIRLNEILGVGYVRDPQARELFPFRVTENTRKVNEGDSVSFVVERDWARSLTVVPRHYTATA
ncbi:MAG: hypothetical protein K2X03_06435 [Bryobacteraceae bacterium]|nr:hypothetical protein [Bryobacteraceae bacterium]